MRIKPGLAALLVGILGVGGLAHWLLNANGRSPGPGLSAPPVSNQADAAIPTSPPQSTSAAERVLPPAPVASPGPSIEEPRPQSAEPASQAAEPSASEPVPPIETVGPPISTPSASNPMLPALPPVAAPAPAPAPQSPAHATPAPSGLSSLWPSGEAGLSDADRRGVQEALRKMGYYVGAVDGKFGPVTRAAIRRFQQDLWVSVTGYLTGEQANRLLASGPEPDRAM